MNARRFGVCLLALLFNVGASKAAEILVCIYEDSMGHLIRTRELTIYVDGRVVEETYDFSDGAKKTHSIRERATLRDPALAIIRKSLSDNGFERLPAAVEAEEGIIPDAPFRMIKTARGKEVEWNNFTDHPKTRNGILFDAVWRDVLAVLGE